MNQNYFDITSERWSQWWSNEAFLLSNLGELLIVVLLFFIARSLTPFMRGACNWLRAELGDPSWVDRILQGLVDNAAIVSWLGLQWLSYLLARKMLPDGVVLHSAICLLAAWIAILLSSRIIARRSLRFLTVLIVVLVAGLNIAGLWDKAFAVLDAADLHIAGIRISIVAVAKGLALFWLLLGAALIGARAIERQIGSSERLSPSLKVLLGHVSKISLVVVAAAVSLGAIGVDLTAFHVFTGALGVGVGLGLQKVVGNVFSGAMLLLDHSVKPGDVIAVEDTYGWINFMGARYVSVITTDGTEHLIPNETLITTRVENWSYSHDKVRFKVPIGISYKSDPEQAIGCILEAAAEVARILQDPKPDVLIHGFGDSSVDLEARFWIDDPRNGVENVKSDLLMKVWYKFQDAGIEIPFPQRDLHIRSNEANLTAAP